MTSSAIKPNCGVPRTVGHRFTNVHEPLVPGRLRQKGQVELLRHALTNEDGYGTTVIAAENSDVPEPPVPVPVAVAVTTEPTVSDPGKS